MMKQAWLRRALDGFFGKADCRTRYRIRFQPAVCRLEERCLLTAPTQGITIPPLKLGFEEMLAGSSGDLWFSKAVESGVGHITSDGTVTQFVPGPFSSNDLELDPFGNLWLRPLGDFFSLDRLTPTGEFLNASIEVPAAASVDALATPPAAYLPHIPFAYSPSQLVGPRTQADLVGVNPDGSLELVALPTGASPDVSRVAGGPVPIVRGPDGAFWYPDGDGIGRVTTGGFFRHYPLPGGSHDTTSTIAAGPDGNLWFVETKSVATSFGTMVWYADKMGRITPSGAIADVSLAGPGSNLVIANFVPGSDGSIWFDQQGLQSDDLNFQSGTHRIGRINADGTVTYSIPPNDDSTFKITAIGPDGSLWTSAVNVGAVGQTPTITQVLQSQMTADSAKTLAVPAPLPVPPTANNAGYSVTGWQALPVAAPGVLANASGAGGLTAILVSNPAHGSLTLNPDGSFTYTANAGFLGTDSFTYLATSAAGDSNVATVSITVKDPSPVAQADFYAVLPGGTLQVAAPGVLGNDSDPAGKPLTAALSSGPAGGSLALNADGSFNYTPYAGFTGSDSFSYTAGNGTGSSSPTTVTIDVGTTPVARDVSFTVVHDQATALPYWSTATDPLGHFLFATVQNAPSHGSLKNGPNDSILYVPAAGYIGPDSFTYQVADTVQVNDPAATDGPISNVATVTIDVTNTVPVAVNHSYSLNENNGQNLIFPASELLNGSSDPDGDTVTLGELGQPAHGTLEPFGAQFLNYSADPGFSGTDQFSYTVSDGVSESSPAVVSITVIPIDPAPSGSDLSLTTNQGTPVSGTLPVSAADGDPLSVTLVQVPARGTIAFNGTRDYTGDKISGGSGFNFTYTPNSGFSGSDNFVYTVNDGENLEAVYTVTLTVNAVAGPVAGGSSGPGFNSDQANGAGNPGNAAGVIQSPHDFQTGSVGAIGVAVDSLPNDLGPGAKARIDDAIATLGAQLLNFSVHLYEATGSAIPYALVHVHFSSTTSIGGAAQGVLGVEYGHEITILDGWNWYLGNDPASIGADQYDFETVVMHELGHAVGLAHSPDQASVMYWDLSPATVRHALSPGDMALIDRVETAAREPLMAAPFVTGQARTPAGGPDELILRNGRLVVPNSVENVSATTPARLEDIGQSHAATLVNQPLPLFVAFLASDVSILPERGTLAATSPGPSVPYGSTTGLTRVPSLLAPATNSSTPVLTQSSGSSQDADNEEQPPTPGTEDWSLDALGTVFMEQGRLPDSGPPKGLRNNRDSVDYGWRDRLETESAEFVTADPIQSEYPYLPLLDSLSEPARSREVSQKSPSWERAGPESAPAGCLFAALLVLSVRAAERQRSPGENKVGCGQPF